MTAYRSLAATLAAAALVNHVNAWNIDLPPCLSPFKPFVYAGCYQDGSPGALTFRSDLDQQDMTIEKCMAECKGNGYRYAGLEYYGVCFCGNTVAGPQVDESSCSFPCTSNASEICGGDNVLSVYQDPTFLPISETTIDEYVPLGCWTDDSSEGRTLSYPQDAVNGASLTTASCLTACRDEGYPFAGTEYSGECWCGQVLGNFSQSAPESDCTMPCNGNAKETCGGRGRLSLYVAKDLESLEPCGYVPPTTTAPSTPTPTQSVCVATTTIPSGCEYGCGKWCSHELPDWSNVDGCKSSFSSCKIQIAACLKNAGFPGAMDCFDFAGWCSDIGNYCSTGRKRTVFNKKDCFSHKPPKGGKPPTTKTITVPCTTTPTPTPTTTTQCPIPTVTNICKQPTSNKDGYGPGNPVGGVELPVVTCNDLRDDFTNNPFKLYTDSDSRRCPGYSRTKVPNACADACKAQYDDCVSVYAEGCKASNGGSSGSSWWDVRSGWGPNGFNAGKGSSGGSSGGGLGGILGWLFGKRSAADDKSYFDFAAGPAHEKRTFGGWNDNYSSATSKCKTQYNDCLSENKKVTIDKKCTKWGSGW